jgi:hypothetical protein
MFKVIAAIASIFLVLEVIGCILLLLLLSKPSVAVQQIINSGISKDSYPGAVLFDKDKKIEQRNQEIILDSKTSEVNISIWDFAAIDGDYVQLIHDDKTYGEPFMISHGVKSFIVPAKGKLEIKGVKDGGGGITYAMNVKETGETYFNDAPEGGFNTYTIQKRNN